MKTSGRGGKTDVNTAEAILDNLRQWSRGLPAMTQLLDYATDTDLGTVERQRLIAKIHMACAYYFSVILVTRPFLVASLLARLHASVGEWPNSAVDRMAESKVSKLAEACISSARYMTDMCSKFTKSAVLSGNMTLIQ